MIHHLFHLASSILTSHFLLVWLFSLVFVVAGGLLLSTIRGQIACSPLQQHVSANATKVQPQFSTVDGFSLVLFCLFAMFYMSVILYKEDFCYYDDDLLTEFSVQGKNFAPPILNGDRFFPMSGQEFNLLRFVTRSPFGYHSLVVMQLVILIVLIFLVVKNLKVRYRCLVTVTAMLAPSFLIPFMGFVYPERNVLFGLAILLLCLQGYSKTQSRMYFVGCLVATHFILYYKETAVLFVVAFAVTRAILQTYRARRTGLRSWRPMVAENALSIGILGVAAIYTALFLVVMLPHRNFSYIAASQHPLSSVLTVYLQFDCLPFLLLGVFLLRLKRFLISQMELDSLWDSLAVGAITYFIGILALRINSGYYMAPVDFIAIFYLANMARLWLQRPARVRVFSIAGIVITVMSQAAVYSSVRAVERKETIAAKAGLAEFLKNYLPTIHKDSVELFFPYANGYHLMGLSSYLNYKGFRLDGQGDSGSKTGPKIIFKGREKFADNKCMGYRDYSCIHAEDPSPGAIVVVLPDDSVSNNELRDIAKDFPQLFYLDCPVCTAHPRWFNLLHAISAEYSLRPLPGHWLQLHVFQRPS
jgi:hypothetical protein